MKFLAGLLLTLLLLYGCSKENSTPCNFVKAGADLRFRIVDSNGRDLLLRRVLNRDSLIAVQPCRTDTLVPLFNEYRLPGSTDSGITLRFGNLRTPNYGEPGECYRVFFRWNANDVDTFDWHYRVEESGGCPLQIIDYISYNGVQSKFRDDHAFQYYELVK